MIEAYDTSPRIGRVILWLSMLLTAGILVGAAVFGIHSARASEAWKVEVDVTMRDGHTETFTYGNNQTGPHLYESEAACKDALAATELVNVRNAMRSIANDRGDTVGEFRCVLILQKPGDTI